MCDLSHRTPVLKHDGTNFWGVYCLADIIIRFFNFHAQPLGGADVDLIKGLLYLTWGDGIEDLDYMAVIAALLVP